MLQHSVSMQKKSISSHKALPSSETPDSDDFVHSVSFKAAPVPNVSKEPHRNHPHQKLISIKRRASTAATLPIFLEVLMKKKEVDKAKEEKSERIVDGGSGGEGDGGDSGGGDTCAPTESSAAVGAEATTSGVAPAEQESSQQKSVEKEEENFVGAEEKETEIKASAFVAALERCMFDTYAEPGGLVVSLT